MEFLLYLLDTPMNITFRQLRVFASIARHHSFSKAATELHLTQSSLSGLIKEMEKNSWILDCLTVQHGKFI